jgi:FdhD protein
MRANEESYDERSVRVLRLEVTPQGSRHSEDDVTREEPLEIQIGGASVAVVMRTPGNDEELVRGFLVTERVVEIPAQIQRIRHCSTAPIPEAEGNVIQVVLSEDAPLDLARLKRNLFASSSCGICGKATIDNALATAAPIDDAITLDAAVLLTLPDALRASQNVFTQTGGLHAAGLFDERGMPLVVREDVGRHNAVDKVVGWAWERGISLEGRVLMVSGRVSYEIVQKALAARIPIIAAVSAPSSLAIELARAANVTLIGFLRAPRFSIYAGESRISGLG